MPKRKSPVTDCQLARDILEELEIYAKDKQFYPVQNALLGHMKRSGYDVTTGEYNYWFNRLVSEGYIEVDNATRAIRAVRLIIVERDSVAE